MKLKAMIIAILTLIAPTGLLADAAQDQGSGKGELAAESLPTYHEVVETCSSLPDRPQNLGMSRSLLN